MTSKALARSAPLTLSQAQRRLAWRTLIIVLSGLLLLGAVIVSLGRGAQSIPAGDVLAALRDPDSVSKATNIIVNRVRLPRMLTGALVGINLAVAGTMLQGAVRSPLADPYILGISAGGGLAAATASIRTDMSPNSVATMAFVGCLVGALIVYMLAWDGSRITATRLVLAGVALTAMMNALTVTVIASSLEAIGQIVLQWLVGGLYTAGWDEYHLIAPYTGIGFVGAMLLASRANILALGDDMAQGLGVNVTLTRFLMGAVAAVMAGSSVAVAGLIGFVGLVVPFVARLLVGSDFRFLIPTSMILGAAFVIFSDFLARTLLPQTLIGAETNIEFPVGIVTALFGGPLFLWLVRARRPQW